MVRMLEQLTRKKKAVLQLISKFRGVKINIYFESRRKSNLSFSHLFQSSFKMKAVHISLLLLALAVIASEAKPNWKSNYGRIYDSSDADFDEGELMSYTK